MFCTVVTLPMFQDDKSMLKEDAFLNIESIFVTLLTVHLLQEKMLKKKKENGEKKIAMIVCINFLPNV